MVMRQGVFILLLVLGAEAIRVRNDIVQTAAPPVAAIDSSSIQSAPVPATPSGVAASLTPKIDVTQATGGDQAAAGVAGTGASDGSSVTGSMSVATQVMIQDTTKAWIGFGFSMVALVLMIAVNWIIGAARSQTVVRPLTWVNLPRFIETEKHQKHGKVRHGESDRFLVTPATAMTVLVVLATKAIFMSYQGLLVAGGQPATSATYLMMLIGILTDMVSSYTTQAHFHHRLNKLSARLKTLVMIILKFALPLVWVQLYFRARGLGSKEGGLFDSAVATALQLTSVILGLHMDDWILFHVDEPSDVDTPRHVNIIGSNTVTFLVILALLCAVVAWILVVAPEMIAVMSGLHEFSSLEIGTLVVAFVVYLIFLIVPMQLKVWKLITLLANVAGHASNLSIKDKIVGKLFGGSSAAELLKPLYFSMASMVLFLIVILVASFADWSELHTNTAIFHYVYYACTIIATILVIVFSFRLSKTVQLSNPDVIKALTDVGTGALLANDQDNDGAVFARENSFSD